MAIIYIKKEHLKYNKLLLVNDSMLTLCIDKLKLYYFNIKLIFKDSLLDLSVLYHITLCLLLFSPDFIFF